MMKGRSCQNWKKKINLQEEINGIIEELSEEDEMDITDINNLIYAAATIITLTMNEPSKRRKNRRNVKFWKKGMHKQTSSRRKELSIIAETGTGSDNGELNWKKRKIFQKCRVTNTREVAQLTEALKQKVQEKAQRIRRYEKGKPSRAE
jgi:lactate dehydrogenase-like 2-hydroxyacid dehydrogenase